MKARTILLVFTLLLSLKTFAQTKQQTRVQFERKIQLEDCKKKEEITISIAPNTKEFRLNIDSSVSSGKVTIEIYDANGKKQGDFSVGTQLNIENAEHAIGTINKNLLEPDEGEWKVKIIPVNAKGIIKIHTLSYL